MSRDKSRSQVQTYDTVGDSDSPTVKKNSKVELSQMDLLHILSCLEGELEAREITIAALKSERAQHLLHDAKYGRVALRRDPFRALERDSNAFIRKNEHKRAEEREDETDNAGSDTESFDDAAAQRMYEDQLSALDNVVETQRKVQKTIGEQISSISTAYETCASELDQIRVQKANDDDARVAMADERDTLRNSLATERARSIRLESELAQVLDFALALKADNIRQRRVAIDLIRDRRRLQQRLREDRERRAVLEAIVKEMAATQDEKSAAAPQRSDQTNSTATATVQDVPESVIPDVPPPKVPTQASVSTIQIQSVVAVPVTVSTTRANANLDGVPQANGNGNGNAPLQTPILRAGAVSQPASVVRYATDSIQRPPGGVLTVSVNSTANSSAVTNGAVPSPPLVTQPNSGSRTAVTPQSGVIEKRPNSVYSTSPSAPTPDSNKVNRLSATNMPVTISQPVNRATPIPPAVTAKSQPQAGSVRHPNSTIVSKTPSVVTTQRTAGVNASVSSVSKFSTVSVSALSSRPLNATAGFVRASPQRASLNNGQTPSATATVICGGSSSTYSASVPMPVSVPVVPSVNTQKPKAAQPVSVNAK